jgi:DNA helicase IV
MDQKQKKVFFTKASNHLSKVINVLNSEINIGLIRNKKIQLELPKINEDDKLVQNRLLEHGIERVRELEALLPSPYFVHCIVEFENGELEDLFFGKFQCIDEKIYSWITPASSLRFENPGNISYIQPDGTKRNGILRQKDQYMIADGNIVYLSTESIDNQRELVYQKYFTKQKKGFVLPEIVSQMEKAQDTVIRANHKGSLLIAGPAGSGKTTLALHRVAYLAQSPDVSDDFKPTSIIIFVQDTGTRDYFSHLLPELGIKGVRIMTFDEWAMNILDVKWTQYVYRFGKNEKEKDIYEFKKKKALKIVREYKYSTNIFIVLKEIYKLCFSEDEIKLFEEQKKQKVLDRFDLIILLILFKKKYGELTSMQEYYQMAKNGAAKKKIGRFPISYSLMIFDEFQNYLPEQIILAKSTVNKDHNSIMYVGDLAQQTKLGTIQKWEDIGEKLEEERCVVLQKVYRNTKNILQYIRDVGYEIDISENIKEGDSVIEKITKTKQEELEYIISLHKKFSNKSIGVITKDKEYLNDFESLELGDNVYLMSIHEAQGVEFDIVCIVGISKDTFFQKYTELEYLDLTNEKKQIDKDLLYVALTRPIESLHVLGRVSLRGMMK